MTGTRVLVIGGTGPTGPHIVGGLRERGHEVTVFHRGVHESPELAGIEHIHGDPHFRESIDEALAGRDFDLVLAMYGRVRHLAPALAGRCDRFVAVGGIPVYDGYFPHAGAVLPIPVTEDHPVVREDGGDPARRFSRKLAEGERTVFDHHPAATILRFPMIYGPNNARPAEWSIVRRVRDGRRRMILPDGGFQIHTRCAARNAAGFVLAAIDHPDAAAGQVYNCGDHTAWSLRQWADAVLALLGAELELVAIPGDIAVEAATTLLPLANTTATHCLLDTGKARRDLHYRQVVEPLAALAETIDRYRSRDLDSAEFPSLTDRFDYDTEDAVIDGYRRAASDLRTGIVQHPAPPVHSMPHPVAPGSVDHRGR
ncbi:NAD-dependent epimerase/dehydratase family protein [Nocardia sp. BMG111209]|uniref:NAD-dependent epimerase/dehydratase family protein n=1 Tax=Nocardia sp. BMG111209 TaxID=1160137 RepID=UPI000363C569|nr:NAD-dependent epimerase/dehydratase family protein [Nocardia sp. BMG111209]